jgi:hypothetical protein
MVERERPTYGNFEKDCVQDQNRRQERDDALEFLM